MRTRFLRLLLALPVLLLCLLLVGVERVYAPCNTPPPVPPNRPGVPGTPGVPRPSTGVPGRRGGSPTFGFASSWRIWWDFNREFLLGLRGVTKVVKTDGDDGSAVDPMAVPRARVRVALKEIALGLGNEEVRAAALCALGRAAQREDAAVFLKVLASHRQPREVLQGAAIGLAFLPQIENEETRTSIRELYDALLADRVNIPGRARLVAIIALSVRGRHDPSLVRSLSDRIGLEEVDFAETPALLFGSGLSRSDLAIPLLLQTTRSGELGHSKLPDVARSYGVLALAQAGGAEAAKTLTALLSDRDVQAHTKRSACIALGHLFREGSVADADREGAENALIKGVQASTDPLVRGYATIALGFDGSEPAVKVLVKALDDGSNVTRPYAALALGLVARNMPADKSSVIRKLLLDRYRVAKGQEMPGALAVALGLAGATEARDFISKRVASPRTKANERAPACQALGLLAGDDDRAAKALRIALGDRSDEVVQNAALGLGLRGNQDYAMPLVRMLATTRSGMVQAHLVRGLSHIGGTDIVDPLLALLGDGNRKVPVRVSAATALGFIIAPREKDLLFELDAYCNPFGMTEAGRALVTIF